MAGNALQYAQWLVDHKDDANSPDESVIEKFNTVKNAYKLSGGDDNKVKEDFSTPSKIPLFNQARESGFLKGYMDQASGVAQVLSRLQSPSIAEGQLKMAGIDVPSMDEVIEREEREYQIRRKEEGDTGIDWARIGGNIVNPVSVGTMGVSAPAATASIAKKVLAGSALGGVSMGTHPVTDADADFGKSKATQVAGGLIVGGAVPAAMVPLKGAFDVATYLARPFSKAGQLADLKKVYISLAGDARDDIIASLESAATKVKGSKPTSGQAIAEGTRILGDDGLPKNFGGSIVKLEQDLSKKSVTGEALKDIYGKQAARRSDAIDNLVDAGEDALTNAINTRADAVKPFYDVVEASSKKVDVKDVLTQIKKYLITNRNEDSVVAPLLSLQGKLLRNGAPETSPQALHSLSKHIGTLMSRKTPGGQNEFDVASLNAIKSILDKKIGEAEPAYKMARDVFKKYSEPVNQISVSRHLGKALESSIERESPAKFLNAIADAPKTLKKSTGFARYEKLSDVMNAKQMKEIMQVKSELIRQAKERELASKTESVLPILEGSIEPSLPNMLSRPMMLANAVLAKIGHSMGPKYEALAIKIQKDPKLLAEILKLPTDNPKRKATTELLARFSGMIPSQGAAPEVAREF